MFEIIMYSLIVLAAIFFFTLLLPVKFFIKTAGGTEGGIEISGRIMIFSGIFGGGILYRRNFYKLNIFLCSRRLLTLNVTPIVKYFSEKEKKRKVKKVDISKKKKPWIDRIKIHYSKGITFRKYFRPVFRDFREIIRIDQFSVNIKFGLGNPYLTGKLIGIIYMVNSFLPHPYVINPSWDFTKSMLKGELAIQVTCFSHIFWRKIIINLPLIISIIREHRSQKQYSDNSFVIQEV